MSIASGLKSAKNTGQDAGTGSGSKLFSRLVLMSAAFLLFVSVAGYPVFRSEIAALRNAGGEVLATKSDNPQVGKVADGIVVLTGDRKRIQTGFELFENGIAERMLISGVHQHTSRAAVFRLGGIREKALPCCVDIGYAAVDTIGNAAETAEWAARHGMKRLVVVTSDYHMPRSLLELSHQMPGMELVPHVAERGTSTLPRGHAQARAGFVRHSLREYGKYLVAHLRLAVGGLRDPARLSASAAE